MATRAEPLAKVLACVRFGQTAYVCLSDEQRRALDSDEGRMALSIALHFVAARTLAPGVQRSFPYTAECVRRVGRRIGLDVTPWQARRLRDLALVLFTETGSYMRGFTPTDPRPGFRVRLYRLAIPFTTRRPAGLPAASTRSSGEERQNVKQVKRGWWTHRLFGTPDQRPPPLSPRRRQRSLDESMSRWQVAACERGDLARDFELRGAEA